MIIYRYEDDPQNKRLALKNSKTNISPKKNISIHKWSLVMHSEKFPVDRKKLLSVRTIFFSDEI